MGSGNSANKSRVTASQSRSGTGKARRTRHLETPDPSIPERDGAKSGNPNGLRRTWNQEQLELRRVDALRMRIQGVDYRAIGEALGISAQTAWRDVKNQLATVAVETATELRALEYAGLMKARSKAMQVLEASSGEMALKAVDRVERLSRSMRVLFGLDVPTRIDVTHHEISQQDLELQEMIREANAANETAIEQIAHERANPGE